MSVVAVPDAFVPVAPAAAARTIVIIGAGFSGTALAIQLLRRPPEAPTHVVLIERNGAAGRGVAYASTSYPYLLNVAAGRMSINPAEPLEFLQFARRRYPTATAQDFLPRALYGEYLQTVLREAELAAAPQVTFAQRQADVRRIETTADAVSSRIVFADGAVLSANEVVLATGNPPPAELPGAETLTNHSAYASTPWSIAREFSRHDSVLIVGTGLSMVDVVMKLTDNETNMPTVHAVSRRGLLPLTHGAVPHTPALRDDFDALLWPATSARRLLRATRYLSRALAAHGSNWREVIAYLRQIAPRVWQRLPAHERRRFTRHLQCYWDVCRHLLPATVSDHLNFVRQQGKLQVHAGRIQRLQADGERIRVYWRRRGETHTQETVFDAVVNATGPDFNVQRARDPLLQALHASGNIAADPLGLGIRTDGDNAVIDQRGVRHRGLFYLGPLLRATDWETTAAPELFRYAERLAEHLRHTPTQAPSRR